MAFALVGRHHNEAFDEETGILIVSKGARGPEIQNNHWEASVGDLRFEFSSRIGDEGDESDGRRNAYLSPSPALIEYLQHGAGDNASRKALVDRMAAGILFLTPIVHYRSPVIYVRAPASSVRRTRQGVTVETLDAPNLWEAGSIVC